MTSDKKIFLKGIFIWFLVTMFYFFDNLLNVAPATIEVELKEFFKLSNDQFGLLSSFYLWPYGLMQIPVGLMMDKFGPRRLLIAATLLCGLGCMVFAISDSFALACFGRALIGFGASFAVIGCTKIAAIWFPTNFALFFGLMAALGMFGSAIGLYWVKSIVSIIGWQYAFQLSTVVCLLFCVLFYLFVLDTRTGDDTVKTYNSNAPTISVSAGLIEIIKAPQSWLLATYAGLMFIPTQVFAGLWGVPYLRENFALDTLVASRLNALIYTGWIVGSPIYGYLSDKIGRRNLLMYGANLSTLIVMCWLFYGKSLNINFIDYTVSNIGVAMFLIGFFSSGFALAFSSIKEIHRANLSGTVVGYINTVNTWTVAAFQWFIGYLLSFGATSASPNHSDYQNALVSIPICLLVSLVILMFVRETYCKQRGN